MKKKENTQSIDESKDLDLVDEPEDLNLEETDEVPEEKVPTILKDDELQQILESHRKYLNNEEGGIKADFAWRIAKYANLQGLDLSEVDFSNSILSGADFRNAKLIGANFEGTDMRYTLMNEADLTNADLTNSNFTEADLILTKLVGAKLAGINLNDADLDRTIF